MEFLKIRKGYLTLLAGEGGAGKTTAALSDMVNRAPSNDSAMFFSYEFSQSVLYQKLIKFFDFDFEVAPGINVVALPHCGLDTIGAAIRIEKPSLVYIDYCNRVRIYPETENLHSDFGKRMIIVCQELSRIAKELDIPVVLVISHPRDGSGERRIDAAFHGPLGLKAVMDGIQYDNVIPMSICRDVKDEWDKSTIYLFDKKGMYEKYSELDITGRYMEEPCKKRAYRLFETNTVSTEEVGKTKGLLKIHNFLFKGFYSFAGQIRNKTISKGGFTFANGDYLSEALAQVEAMPQATFDEIAEKYVEMNVAHPFLEGNGRATRIWLDLILMQELKKCIDWSKIGKKEYLVAMKESPYSDAKIKNLLHDALSDEIDNWDLIRKGIDASFDYEKGE